MEFFNYRVQCTYVDSTYFSFCRKVYLKYKWIESMICKFTIGMCMNEIETNEKIERKKYWKESKTKNLKIYWNFTIEINSHFCLGFSHGKTFPIEKLDLVESHHPKQKHHNATNTDIILHNTHTHTQIDIAAIWQKIECKNVCKEIWGCSLLQCCCCFLSFHIWHFYAWIFRILCIFFDAAHSCLLLCYWDIDNIVWVFSFFCCFRRFYCNLTSFT